ncbi:MAG TPA: hypothetical protein DET40_10890 [Lentisphaeria bacterium]|nr:MAG: hypothetical protein A2X45_11445 [Lentisphaerae bacterium GWF2_50_93]HCE44043.1 hypothetical protein [Lentisphaeria bacterium]
MIKLKDIAEKTGVSISVVSRTLNPKPDKNAFVSDRLRKKITKAAKELGYQRNRMAEFLQRGKNVALGVFIPEAPNRLVADLMFGISRKAAELKFPLEFHFGMTYVEYRKFIDTVSVSNSGIITYPSGFSLDKDINRTIRDYVDNGGHVVVLNTYEALDVPVILIDDFHGGRIAAEHLLGRNCRTYLASSRYGKRTEGFVETIKKNGARCILFDDDTFESVLKKVLDKKNMPVGVFATYDVLAMKIMAFLQNNSVNIGKDVLLMGYDDLFTVGYLNPPLTTIHQPFKELGELSVVKIVNMIDGKNEISEKILPSLVKRATA